MAETAIMQLKEAEEHAREILANARAEAEQLIRSAQDETAAAYIQCQEDARKKAADMRAQARQDAQSRSEAYMVETAELCATAKEKMTARKTEAIGVLVQLLTE